MTRRRVFAALAGLAVVLGLIATPLAARETDAFYLGLLRDGIAAGERGDTAEAATTLRLACFGLLEEPKLLAQGLVHLGIAQAKLGDVNAFRSTYNRLAEIESRFGAYSQAEVAPDVRAAFAAEAASRIPPATLAATPAFAQLAGARLRQDLAKLSPRQRRKEIERRLEQNPGDPLLLALLAELDPRAPKPAPAAAPPVAAPTTPAATPAAPTRSANVPAPVSPPAQRPDAPAAPSAADPAPKPPATPSIAPAPSAGAPATAPTPPPAAAPASNPPTADRRPPTTTSRPVPSASPIIVAPPAAPAPRSPPAATGATAAPPPSGATTPPPAATLPPAAQAKLATARDQLAQARTAADLASASALAKEVADAHPQVPEAQFLVAELAYRASRHAEAVTYFRRGGDPGVDRPSLLFYYAISLHETGASEEARRALERCLPRIAKTPFVERYTRAILGTPAGS